MSYSWTISYPPGAACRTIIWNGKEVAVVNACGDFDEGTEADLAAGLAHAGRMHMILRSIQEDIRRSGDISKSTKAEIDAVLLSVDTIDVGAHTEIEVECDPLPPPEPLVEPAPAPSDDDTIPF